jgi:hypothetical protein
LEGKNGFSFFLSFSFLFFSFLFFFSSLVEAVTVSVALSFPGPKTSDLEVAWRGRAKGISKEFSFVRLFEQLW